MSMFWAGAMMAFAPIVFFGTLIGIWWYKRRKASQRPADLDRRS